MNDDPLPLCLFCDRPTANDGGYCRACAEYQAEPPLEPARSVNREDKIEVMRLRVSGGLGCFHQLDSWSARSKPKAAPWGALDVARERVGPLAHNDRNGATFSGEIVDQVEFRARLAWGAPQPRTWLEWFLADCQRESIPLPFGAKRAELTARRGAA